MIIVCTGMQANTRRVQTKTWNYIAANSNQLVTSTKSTLLFFFYVYTITISVQCVFYVNQAVNKTTSSQTLASVTLLPFMPTPNTPVITPTTSRVSQSERKYEMCVYVCVCAVHSSVQVKLACGA